VKKYLTLLKQTFAEFSQDKVPRLGAALAFYTIFSIAPLLLIGIAIAGLAFGREAAQGQIFTQLKNVLGPTAATAVQEMIRNAAKPKSGTIAAIVGVVTLILGASGVFGQLKDALNTIWDVKPKTGGIMAMIKERFFSAVMVLGVGFLLLVALIIDSIIAVMGRYAQGHLPGGEGVWQALQLAVSFGVVTVLFASIFRYVPDVRIEWRDVWLGAAFTSLLFVIGKFALALYLGKSAVGSSYGAAGSLVVLLLWVYYSAQILLFGAEFTQVYARAHGNRAHSERPTESSERERQDAPRAVKSGGAMKLVAGGCAGLIVGLLAGGIGAVIITVKSVKRLFVSS
jgi:membrane protein